MICYPPLYSYQPTYNLPDGVIADMFAYVFPVVDDLAANGSEQVQIIIQDDSDFEVRQLRYHFSVTEAAFTSGTAPVPNWTVQLTDTGSGRNLFNNALPISCIATGPGQSPRDLPWTKILRRNATLQATFTNFDAAQTTGNLSFVLFGRKLFS